MVVYHLCARRYNLVQSSLQGRQEEKSKLLNYYKSYLRRGISEDSTYSFEKDSKVFQKQFRSCDHKQIIQTSCENVIDAE